MLGYIPGKVTLVLLKLSRNAFWPPTSLKSAGISSLWPQLFPRSGLPGLLGKGEWGKQGWECWEKSICSLQGFPKYSHRFHRDYGCERRAPGELGEGKVNMESLEWMGNPQDSIPWTVTRNQGPAFSCCWDLAWLCPHPLPRVFFPWKSKTLLQSTAEGEGKTFPKILGCGEMFPQIKSHLHWGPALHLNAFLECHSILSNTSSYFQYKFTTPSQIVFHYLYQKSRFSM